ncbi:hypothetical protein FJZ31_28155 [Candidatus Poribacteria bacterium]|nr:hypothetical protein [Candidatus Poribacteria bacterium]
MKKIKIERIGSYDCTHYNDDLPNVVRQFMEQTGIEVDYYVYNPNTIDSDPDVPEYILEAVQDIRAGRGAKGAFFVNGQPVPLGAHSAVDAVAARQKLLDAAGLDTEANQITLSARNFENLTIDGNVAKTVSLSNSRIDMLGTFCSQFGHVHFFDSEIEKLSVDCAVKTFHFAGYDIHKLVEIANQHEELFRSARIGDADTHIHRININDISVRLLTKQDLDFGKHPCIITDGTVDLAHLVNLKNCELFGGWGYVAEHDSRMCGFLGICVKSVAQRYLTGFLPPGDTPFEQTLLLTCFAGGGVFGPEYNRIGIAAKLVQQAIVDAHERRYVCIEANAHDRGIAPLLERCGFSRIPLMRAGNEMFAESTFYRLNIT